MRLVQPSVVDRPFNLFEVAMLDHALSAHSWTASCRDYDLVRGAIRYLSETWSEQPDLNSPASHLGLSSAHVQKVFKRWCGLSPKEFVQAITLDHARTLLAGSANVLEAAHEVGLSGGGRLHDLFVTHEAMTPGDVKRRRGGTDHRLRLSRYAVRRCGVVGDRPRGSRSCIRRRGCRSVPRGSLGGYDCAVAGSRVRRGA